MPKSTVDYPELPKQFRNGSWWSLLGFFGPGAIIACVTIASGETVFASRGGALYGYALLWIFVAGTLCKGLQLYSASRFMTLTSRSPLQSWALLPGPRGWFVWLFVLLTLIWMPFFLSALPKMLGDFSIWVVGFPAPENAEQFARHGLYWGTFYIVAGISMTWFQSYGFLEKAQTAIVVLMLVSMIVAVIVCQPSLLAMFAGLIPQLPESASWVSKKYPDIEQRGPWIEMMVYLGVIGGGAQDYLGYLGTMREKYWGMLGRSHESALDGPLAISESDENIRRGRRWLRAPQIDVGISSIAVLVFTSCFVILGAVILHPRQLVPNGFNLLTEQALFLKVLAGDATEVRFTVDWIYKTGIFFAFFGTIFGAYEIYTRTVHESLIAILPRLHSVTLRTVRFWTLIYLGGGGLLILWFMDKNPVFIITPAALFGNGLLCGLWCYLMIWSDRREVPQRLRMPLLLQFGLVVAGTVLTIGSIIGIVSFVQRYLM